MTRTILLVDAVLATKSQLAGLLEHSDIQIQVATDAQQAIALTAQAYRIDQPFSLIMVDLNLPGLSQADFVRSLRFAGHYAPILAIVNDSSNNETNVENPFQTNDCDAIIQRPLTQKRTLCQIHDLMDLLAI